jgi:glutamine amidotransferase-like uncharacterized protein
LDRHVLEETGKRDCTHADRAKEKNLKNNKRFLQIIAAAVGCLVLATSGYAQQLEKGKVEATGHVGLALGVGTRAAFAGTLGGAINERVFVLGEFGYIPLGGTSASGVTPGGAFEFDAGGKILSFMAGAQYQFSSQRSFVPYAGAALGLVHSSGEFQSTVGSSTQNISVTNNNFYVSFGGGARYYVKDRWGFKPELMIFAGDDSFFRLGVGLFYQFGQ